MFETLYITVLPRWHYTSTATLLPLYYYFNCKIPSSVALLKQYHFLLQWRQYINDHHYNTDITYCNLSNS